MTATSRFAALDIGSAAKLALTAAGSYNMLATIREIRANVESWACQIENRYGMPELDWLNTSAGAPTAAGGDVQIYGRNLLQSQTFDSIALAETTARLTLTMLTPGVSGATVVIATPSGTTAIAYNTTTKVLTITPASGGDTVHNIATAINANGAQTDGHIRATETVAGNITAAQASQALSGGAGDYAQNIIRVAGTQIYPANTTGDTGAAAWSDTAIVATFPNLTALSPALAATDKVSFTMLINGKYCEFPGLILA